MNDGYWNRRYACTIALAEKFKLITCVTEKTVWQDEKDFTLDVPVNLQNDREYEKGKKSDDPNEHLFASMNKTSRKVMVSTEVSYNGGTKPFSVMKMILK